MKCGDAEECDYDPIRSSTCFTCIRGKGGDFMCTKFFQHSLQVGLGFYEQGKTLELSLIVS